jgi:WW domain-containing oxidoreductase
VCELDLGSLALVRRFAARFRGEGRRLHLLVCNAGVMAPPVRGVTTDGLEQQFQVCGFSSKKAGCCSAH